MRDFDECMCTGNEPNGCHECGHVFDAACCCVNDCIECCNDAALEDAVLIMDEFLAHPDTAVAPDHTMYCTECGIVLMPHDLSWNDTEHLRAPRCPYYLTRMGEPVSPWVARALDNTLVAKDMTFAR